MNKEEKLLKRFENTIEFIKKVISIDPAFFIFTILYILSLFWSFYPLRAFVLLVSLFYYYQRELYKGKSKDFIVKKMCYHFFAILISFFSILAFIYLLIESSTIKNYKNYHILILVIFIFIFLFFIKLIQKNKNSFFKIIGAFFIFLESHFVLFSLLFTFVIVGLKIHLSTSLVEVLIPIFTFIPPIIALIEKENPIHKTIIRYSIFLIANLLLIIVFNNMQIPDYTFQIIKEIPLIILFSLVKLLINSFVYFYIIQITYQSVNLCVVIRALENGDEIQN